MHIHHFRGVQCALVRARVKVRVGVRVKVRVRVRVRARVKVGVRVRVRIGVRVGHLRPQPSGVLKVPPSVAYTHLITLADCGERTTPAAEGE